MFSKNKITPTSFFPILCLIVVMAICPGCNQSNDVKLNSPDGNLEFQLLLDDQSQRPFYVVHFEGREIIGKSSLGYQLVDNANLLGPVRIKSVETSASDTIWQPIYGEKNQYRDHYQQAMIQFEGADNEATGSKESKVSLQVRAYNEGIAFRYLFEDQGMTTIQKELTEFVLPATSDVWVSKNAQGAIEKVKIESIEEVVERPLLAQLPDSTFVAIGEAALIDFARMKFVLKENAPATLVADLASEVSYTGNFQSPWRFVMAGNSAGEILENNYLLLNLNEPNQLANTSWIKPGKVIREVTLTTQGGMACVDFAAKHNLQFVEFDAGWYGHEYDDASDATTVTVDPKRSKGPLELQKIIDYASTKGIGILLYVNRRSLEKQLDEVLPLLQSWGVKGVKYGFVNVGSQKWTTWLHDAVQQAAAHELMVDVHDEYRPTGVSRTLPNLMTQEGIRGDEESPDNSQVLKTLFTRMIAGAGDHTNCYFASRVDEKMGSHAAQLAKAICIYSPWQFLYWYDRPEAAPRKVGGAGTNERYIQEVPELTFFDQVPTVWDDTKVLEGYPGEHAVIARKSGSTWFVGAINGDRDRNFEIPLSFLSPNSKFKASIFTDDPESNSPTKVGIEDRSVSSSDLIKHQLAPHQGMAIIIHEMN